MKHTVHLSHPNFGQAFSSGAPHGDGFGIGLSAHGQGGAGVLGVGGFGVHGGAGVDGGYKHNLKYQIKTFSYNSSKRLHR